MKQNCPAKIFIEPLSGKWKGEILFALRDRSLRINELEHNLPAANPRVLKRQLRGLEADGIVQRTIFAEIPPRVEYSLTENGRYIIGLLDAINQTITDYREKNTNKNK